MPVKKAPKFKVVVARARALHAGDYVFPEELKGNPDHICEFSLSENKVRIKCDKSGIHEFRPKDKIEVGRNLRLSRPTKR